MKDKKAALTRGEFIIMMVLVIVAFLIVYFAVVAPTAKAVPSSFGSELCRMNVGLKGFFPTGAKWIVSTDIFCKYGSTIIIYADDWDRCRPEYKEMYDQAKKAGEKGLLSLTGAATAEEISASEKDQILALKSCAAYQIALYADSCWYMFGEDNLNLGASTPTVYCYEIVVRDLGEDVKLKESDIKTAISAAKEDGKFKSNLSKGRFKFHGGDSLKSDQKAGIAAWYKAFDKYYLILVPY